MVFSSAIFLFIFLPVTFLAYHAVPGLKAKNGLLILASLVFYSFGQPRYLLLLLASVVLNYTAGLLLQREGAYRNAVLAAAVTANVGLLAVFKYLDFAVGNLNVFLDASLPLPGIILPIGISFYTFQGMSYIIDVYREPGMGTRNFGKLLLYISFFPQLVAGPIIKYHDISAMIDERRTTAEDTAAGIRRFIVGLSKKLLIANTVGAIADSVFNASPGALDMRLAWLGAVCYTLQIYFDFSGYSDMAIGMGRIFGFRYLENFEHPYISSTIREFWKRWHISLTSWFRDYVYIPLGGNRKGQKRTELNKGLVFLVTGIWHGANWTFLVWGLWHGAFMILEDIGIIPRKKLEHRAIGHIYVMLVVILGFTMFRAADIHQGLAMIGCMFTGLDFTREGTLWLGSLLGRWELFILAAAVVFSADIPAKIWGWLGRHPEAEPRMELLSYIGAVLLLVLDILNLSQTGFNPFIYFQF